MNEKTLIAGLWSGHDCSYCILENGYPYIHEEYERHIREKEPAGDSALFLMQNFKDYEKIKYFVSCYPKKKLEGHLSYKLIESIVDKNDGRIVYVGHHLAHAANAFFSSNFDESLILTIDGGGIENDDDFATAFTVYRGEGNTVIPLEVFDIDDVNIGSVWTRCTRYIFKLQSGWPRGHQAGTVMAMAAFGDPTVYANDFYQMLTSDLQRTVEKPSTQPKGAYISGYDPIHPYLDKWAKIADENEQERFDLAAGLQAATERYLNEKLENAIELYNSVVGEYPKNLCLAGGVVLNSVYFGKIVDKFDGNIYVTPTPHDGGLTLGAAQYMWHQVLGNERIPWNKNFTPFLGKVYEQKDILKALNREEISLDFSVGIDSIVELLEQQKIISVFNDKGSESGRRALGNRSILADPRSPLMKEQINEKVKHRQWFRPFAPSILREHVSEWFKKDIESPYMSFVVEFQENKRGEVPAVVHEDWSARLQTVRKEDNRWYYKLLTKWYEKTGVPILLNTSFNDREPICETPEHAIDCFLGTDIDYLYFCDYEILVGKAK